MPTEPPKIEWRMAERRHHKGYVDGKLRFRIEPNHIFPNQLELFDRVSRRVVKDTADGKRTAEQIIKGELALAAEKILPAEVQLKIASAIAAAAEEAAEAVKKFAANRGVTLDTETIEVCAESATYRAIGGLIAAGLLTKEGVKV